jgi:hypothetical protein
MPVTECRAILVFPLLGELCRQLLGERERLVMGRDRIVVAALTQRNPRFEWRAESEPVIGFTFRRSDQRSITTPLRRYTPPIRLLEICVPASPNRYCKSPQRRSFRSRPASFGNGFPPVSCSRQMVPCPVRRTAWTRFLMSLQQTFGVRGRRLLCRRLFLASSSPGPDSQP